MLGINRSSNPYSAGLRPRRFLEATVAKARMDIILGKKLKKSEPKKAA